MKRDMDLVRAVLLKLEEEIGLHSKTYNFQFENGKLSVPEYTDEEVYSHFIDVDRISLCRRSVRAVWRNYG